MHIGCTLHAGTGLRAERCGSNTKSTLSPLLHPPPNSILTQGRRQLKIPGGLNRKAMAPGQPRRGVGRGSGAALGCSEGLSVLRCPQAAGGFREQFSGLISLNSG